MSSIRIEGLVKRFGPTEAVAGISLGVPSGQVVGLLGPSGCGKTTSLKCIAGLEEPTAGAIFVGERLVAGNGQSVPPEQRDIGMVFQSYALWPHMTVYANVAYPLEMQRVAKGEIRPRVAEALHLVGLAGLEHRYPSQLSGGQQQRVAVARSIVGKPRILLFDEPLSNLDAKLRVHVRGELKRLLKRLGITTVYVTHDQAEAMAVCDRIVLMHAGRIVQDGVPEDLYRRPANLFVAEFIGSGNIVAGSVARHDGESLPSVEVDGLTVRCAVPADAAEGGRVQLVLRREALSLSREPSGTVNCWPMRTVDRTYFGAHVEYVVQVGSTELQVHSADDRWAVDQSGYVSIVPESIICFREMPEWGWTEEDVPKAEERRMPPSPDLLTPATGGM